MFKMKLTDEELKDINDLEIKIENTSPIFDPYIDLIRSNKKTTVAQLFDEETARKVKTILNIVEKQKDEIKMLEDEKAERLKSTNLIINIMKNEKELLKNSICDYNALLEKAIKLQAISGVDIDKMIDLYTKGYSITNYKIGVDLSFDDYVPKDKIRNMKEYAKEQVEHFKDLKDEKNANIWSLRYTTCLEILGEE